MKGKTLAWAALAAFFLASSLLFMQLPGCGGGGGGVVVGGGAATGTLQVGITDSPAFPEFISVHITIDKVVAVPAGKEGLGDNDPGLPVIVTFPGGQDVDILNLHFLPQILGTTNIPAGSYNQIRLILAPNKPNNPNNLKNYVILAGNPNRIPLTTPSAQQTGLKVVGKFTVTPGAFNTIVLDFNPNDAIVIAGNSDKIILKPTGIRINQVFNSLTNAGGVSGTIRSPLFEPWSSATVSVFPRDPAGKAVTSGVVFSNFSSPSVWKAPFAALVPPTSSAVMPSANYKVFVQAYRDTRLLTPTFDLYSSPAFQVTTGVDTPVPPNGIVLLGP